jgi:tRNA threonylcarbamoyladenosine modification (KEOPS) complex  Pcc1 subunit
VSKSEPDAFASLSFNYGKHETANTILKAIEPDNVKSPPGISIDTEIEGSTLLVRVSCERGIGSLIATIDDLLSCIQAAERAIGELRA